MNPVRWALSAFMPSLRAEGQPAPDDDFWYTIDPHSGFKVPFDRAVSPQGALAVAAVYACVRVLRESLGTLPLKVYRRTNEDTVEQARDHDIWRVLQRRPNAWMTPQEWKEMGVLHLCLRGNFYCRITGSGQYTQLIPLSPDRVKPKQLDSGRLVYEYRPEKQDRMTIQSDDMLHVRGMTLDGIVGLSVIEFAHRAIGSAQSLEKHSATLFGKGAIPPFWISRPAGMRWTPDAIKNFRQNWREVQAGPNNASNPPILQDDMALHALPISNKDLQHIEGRGFTADEICGFFGVHPVLAFRSETTAGNNEEISQQFKTYTLAPLGGRFEQAVDRDLLDDGQPGSEEHFARFTFDGLTRATMKNRYEAHNIAVQGGWKTVNEVRRNEDLNPIDGGDEPHFPLNMQPAGGGPDWNEQGGQPGKGNPKPPSKPKRPGARAKTEAAFRILLREAAGRIAAAEIHGLEPRAARASEDRDKFNKWAVRIYRKQLDYVAKTVDPICAAWLAKTGRAIDPDVVARTVQGPVAEVFDPAVDVPGLLTQWKTERAETHAKRLEEVFFDAKV